MLLTEAFGGAGGIAEYNRCFLTALCKMPEVTEVVAVVRSLPSEPDNLPDKLAYRVAGTRGKVSFILDSLKTIAGGRFDLIVCGHTYVIPVAVMLQLLRAAPILLIIHGVDAWTPTKYRLSNWFMRRMNGLIASSRTTLERFLTWAQTHRIADRKYVLPCGVDVTRFTPGERRADLVERFGLEGKKVLMTLARLDAEERYKGFDEVLGVLPELAKRHEHIVYVIGGTGSDKSRLQALAKDLGVDERVIFAGWIDESDKVDFLRLADVFVMPGRGEGYGIVYIEARACGVAAVGSVLDGSRDALQDGVLGALVNPDDPADIIRGIEAGLAEPPGVVPPEIEKASLEAFERRVGEIVQEMSKQ